jgi:hypothetical protein
LRRKIPGRYFTVSPASRTLMVSSAIAEVTLAVAGNVSLVNAGRSSGEAGASTGASVTGLLGSGVAGRVAANAAVERETGMRWAKRFIEAGG